MQAIIPSQNSPINSLNDDCFLRVAEQLNSDVRSVTRIASTCRVLHQRITNIKIPLYTIFVKAIEEERAKMVAEQMQKAWEIKGSSVDPKTVFSLPCTRPPGISLREVLANDAIVLRRREKRLEQKRLEGERLRPAIIERMQLLNKRKENLKIWATSSN
jgi:hypothetical protein